jgi:large subunit ribosomal protein L18
MVSKVSRVVRQERHKRVRKKIVGIASRPRLCVFRSLNHIYAQVIDDSAGRTLVSVSTLEPALKSELNRASKTKEAELAGALLARRAVDQGIKRVVFDRGGYQYHGRVKALAETARKGGLEF